MGFNLDLSNKHETNVYNDYQGEFKTGILNFDLLNEAYTRHCIDNYFYLYNMKLNMVVTHWDLLNGIEYFPFIFNEKRDKFTDKLTDNLGELFRFFPKDLRISDVFVNGSVESNLEKLDF